MIPMELWAGKDYLGGCICCVGNWAIWTGILKCSAAMNREIQTLPDQESGHMKSNLITGSKTNE
jgi:hypothetical protein